MDETSHDFGEVEQGEEVTHIFRFSNAGHGELTISAVRTCCSTKARFPYSTAIQSRERRKLKLLCAKGYPRRRTKTVRLHSNNASQSTAALKINAVVDPIASIEPQQLVFGGILKGGKKVGDVRVLQIDRKELGSIRVESLIRYPSTKIRETHDTSRNGFQISVALTTHVPSGDFRDILKIRSIMDSHLPIEIPVEAVISREVYRRSCTPHFRSPH